MVLQLPAGAFDVICEPWIEGMKTPEGKPIDTIVIDGKIYVTPKVYERLKEKCPVVGDAL